MIQITAQHRLILKVEPVDFRKGIDGLVGYAAPAKVIRFQAPSLCFATAAVMPLRC